MAGKGGYDSLSLYISLLPHETVKLTCRAVNFAGSMSPGIQMRAKGHNEIKLFWHEGQIGEAQLRRIGT